MGMGAQKWATNKERSLGYTTRHRAGTLGIGISVQAHQASQAQPGGVLHAQDQAEQASRVFVIVVISPLPHLQSLADLVSLVEHHLWESSYVQQLSETVPIFLTAVLEFLAHRLLELAGNETQQWDTQRLIIPELLDMAVYNNLLFSELFQLTTISQGAQFMVVFLGIVVVVVVVTVVIVVVIGHRPGSLHHHHHLHPRHRHCHRRCHLCPHLWLLDTSCCCCS